MHRTYAKKLVLLLILAFFVLGLTTCKKPTDNISVIVNTSSLFKAPLLIHFENANSASTRKPGDFKVTITGQDADLVQMGSGGTDFKAAKGFLSLALRAHAKPTPANPLTFNIYAEISGYAPVNRTISITKDTTLVFNIPVLEYSKPADGTSVLEVLTPLNNGSTTAVVNLATATTATLAEKATVTIPAATQLQDASKTLINASQLKTNLLLYGTATAALGKIFPGGFYADNVIDKNGVPITDGLNFVTAGLLSIDMVAGSTTVKNFSKPLEVNQELQNGLINFATGNAVKVGETIPLWSLNEQTGQWKEEGVATVLAGTGGKLVARYQVTHLSSWNLSWTWSASTSALLHQLDIHLLPSVSDWSGVYDVQLQTSNGNYLIGFRNYQAEKDLFQLGKFQNGMVVYSAVPGKYGFGLPYVPNINAAKVVVFDQKGAKLGESTLFNPTTASVINVNVNIPRPPEYVGATANFTATCTSMNIVAPLNTWIDIYDVTDKVYTYVYLKNGSFSNNEGGVVKLIVGHQYTISSNYNGTLYTTSTFTASKSNFNIPSGSNNLTASVSYNATTNTFEIKGNIDISCN